MMIFLFKPSFHLGYEVLNVQGVTLCPFNLESLEPLPLFLSCGEDVDLVLSVLFKAF
jgi:hypothetical protein